MKLDFTNKPREKKKIKECKAGEAFRWGDNWYTKVEIDDTNISNFGSFYDGHCIHDMSEVMDYN